MIAGRMAAIVVFSSVTLLFVTATAAVQLLSTTIARRLEHLDSSSRADALFLLRVLPTVLAILVSAGLILPTFLWFEPSNSQERIPATMIVGAACGGLLLARVAWRAIRALSDTRELMHAWRSRARSVAELDAPIPAFAIEDEFPTVAVVGMRRPLLFMSARLLEECTLEETRAMILHEYAHVEAHDNARRLLLRACPNLFGWARRLEAAWEAASEEAADATVARRAPHLALSLAQALVRVGRLVPQPFVGSASALHSGGSIESRVRHLLAPASPRRAKSGPLLRVALTLAVASSAIGVAIAAPSIHQVIERLVAVLP